jgi:hypothetical protein
MSSCEHAVGDTVVGAEGTSACGACDRETRLVSEERTAILALIEDTVKTWKDGADPHPMVEVILARIRARS